MAKTYRTARGKHVDLHSLLNQNENVRAVGNMNVNARGDLLDSQNKTIESRNARINKQYRKQIANSVTDDVVYSSRRAAELAQQPTNTETAPEVKAVSKTEEVEPTVNFNENTPKGGLAAALAKAREVKQEPLKSPRQLAKEQEGVKKI